MTARVVIISGAASGIGRACAREMQNRGWRVAALDLQPAPEADLSVITDMTEVDAVAAAVRCAEDELGTPSAVVSVAGHYAMVPFEKIDHASWQRMLRVHLGGLLNLARAVVPGMTARGEGSIVGVTSELAVGGGDGDAHYAAAKGAVIGLVRSLASELAATGVRVNAVAPGPTDTPLIGPDSPWRAPDYLATLPSRRLVTPEEIALTTAFLIEDGTFFCGEVVSPNAGAVI
jgi:NAD(P)-dependent dehydrogenase (short-subunit alcohol dehydrogenase family)